MRSTKRRGIPAAVVLCLAVVAAAAPASGGPEIVIPPSPSRWATDAAGFVSPSVLDALDDQLRRFSEQNGSQILIYIGKTSAGYSIEEFAVKTFAAWKVGRKGLDDGLVLFIMAEDRKIRIEVGYGLEDRVTDAVASRIINDILLPKIRSGDNDGAVREAVSTVLQTVAGSSFDDRLPAGRRSDGPSGKRSKVPPIFVILGAIIFLIIFITNPRLALWLLFNLLSGGRGGGGGLGGRGGGGFSGGGGRSGGGGASGGW